MLSHCHMFMAKLQGLKARTSVVVNVPAILDDAGPEWIDSTTSTRMGSITYDWDNSYNLEWESISKFNAWLSYEQVAYGIEIW